MRGAGGKAFCAGGDVVSVRAAVLARGMKCAGEKGHAAADFFREEYQLNNLIWEMNARDAGGEGRGGTERPLLQVSLWDGVVMGGGVGLGIGSAFRIVTEKTVFAMPETAIGFFPDVGGSYWLPRLSFPASGQGEGGREGGREEGREGLGRYIGLTGVRLKGWDLMWAGIGTHFVKSGEVDAMLQALEALREGGKEGRMRWEEVEEVLGRYRVQEDEAREGLRTCSLQTHEQDIAEVFGRREGGREGGVEGVLARLRDMAEGKEGGREGGREGRQEWASKTLALLERASPTALKVTWRLLEEGRKGGREGGRPATFPLEYRVAMGHMRRDSDFVEGVRALLVDKDGKPRWKRRRVEEVGEEEVAAYFQPLGEGEWRGR
jgi:enoyl-CoA hydratase/carnithine racemase